MPKQGGVGRGARNKAKSKRRPTNTRQLTAEELYNQAQVALQYDDCESALEALRQAVSLEPENLPVLEAFGSLLAEMGDEEQACSMLRRAIALSPDSGHEKYMYLGQLLEGEDALAMTRCGVELLQGELDLKVKSASMPDQAQQLSDPNRQRRSKQVDESMGENEEDEEESPGVPELQAQLCAALCSLAEQIMGQSDDVEGVASEVEGLLGRAQGICSASPEPGQALASLRYEQGRPEEALELLRASMKLWFRPRGSDEAEDAAMQEEDDGDVRAELGKEAADEELALQPGTMDEDEDADDEEEQGDAMQPSYEFRFECAKLLIELDDSTEVAIQVVEDLVEEDDSNPHTWHLLGLAYYGGHMFEEAQEIYEKGMQLLKKLKIPEDDEVHDDFADLQSAIEEATKDAAEA